MHIKEFKHNMGSAKWPDIRIFKRVGFHWNLYFESGKLCRELDEYESAFINGALKAGYQTCCEIYDIREDC